MEKSGSHVQSVERALRLVDLLAGENREMSLTEIAKAMGWPKSTVHGLLATLRDYQFIDQSPTTGRYHLGIRLFELGNQVARSWNIRTMALPVMQRLSNELGEMVQLATEDKGQVLYIEKIDSTQMIRIVSESGVRLPMHCSGLGKVLLAYKTAAEVKYIINRHGLRPMTRRTITDAEALERELERVRCDGYAMDDREIMDSLRCVAAPIFDREGDVHFAISISGLASSLEGERLQRTREALVEASKEISYAMGHRDEGKQA